MMAWADIGSYALNLACAVTFLQTLLPLFAANNTRVQQFTIQTAKAQALLVTLSMIGLAMGFYDNDFSIRYIAEHSNSLLPWYYRLSAVWGGHEGSLLLWIWILTLWTAAVAIRCRTLPGAYLARILAVLGYIAFGFYLFIIFTSNPFTRLSFAPFDGQDLNPLLQDPGLIFHPPLLYGGYVGFAVAFAFITAALWQGRLDSLWLRAARPWTLAAWLTLTLGIALGSYWAYYELGWGGWWFWDPVENASLMPWLVGTALIHSLIVSEKRGLFRGWTALLAISAFSLSLIGTFLVRSGVLTSVHAFASDATRGIFILILLIAISLPAILLLIFRSSTITGQSQYHLLSKETALLANNWLLTGATFVVLLGTLYPLAADIFKLGKISVGAPYFNRFIVPLAIMILLILAIGPLIRWKRDTPKRLIPSILFCLIFAIIFTAILMSIVVPYWKWQAAIAIFSAGAALAGVILDYGTAITKRGLSAIRPRGSIAGMLITHTGLIIMVLAITGTSLYDDARDLSVKVGKSIDIGEYHLTLTGLVSKPGPNYRATEGRFLVHKQDNPNYTALLTPSKREYFSSSMPMTESARLSTPTHDLYLALGEPISTDTWAIRIQYKPYIIWIWLGAVIMALGGLIAAFDRGYRRQKNHSLENAL
ncbi:heme lyase CcmF/NrfE family subunit [Suttonella ornithocola]|uniref:Cytochrome c-type biogenesis protein CcmF n=1 Tax=Suttonella ornithocola TaxID=279832 RepID=A0A380MWY3_9GAMM|nr:heme lyase CcmF/NrfE family subunit [Suttonella ornithocola]SUO96413.1 Cytochrome c-type biogenesis protein CcmF [Suttonella ornithocola]